MITKFDSLFAGHIDMDNVGYSGIAVNDRLFGNDSLSGVFDKTSNIAKTMDAGGFIDSLFKTPAPRPKQPRTKDFSWSVYERTGSIVATGDDPINQMC